jgi:nucleotide-binding universal stress UspA family protein
MSGPLIVHPTDLSPTSEGAFFHALKLGVAAQAHLSLVHFHEAGARGEPDMDDFPGVRDTLIRWGLLPDGASRAAVGDTLGLLLSKELFEAADPEAGLARMLRRHHAEFMVLGTRGLKGLQALFHHSFSEQLARDARIPTLFVPEGVDGFVDARSGAVRLSNILLPLAEDPHPAGAVRAAVRVCRLLGQNAALHLMHVGDGPPPVRTGEYGGLSFVRTVRSGPVVGTILDVAEEIDADLIVMPTAGHKTFLDALRGSTTEEVLRSAGRPLLAVPERSAYARAARRRPAMEPRREVMRPG